MKTFPESMCNHLAAKILSLAISFVFAFAGVAFAVPLADLLDATGLTWTTGGDPPSNTFIEWRSGIYNHDGEDAAMSGNIAHNEFSWIRTTVTGPGNLAFWWKVDCEAGDQLGFTIDGSQRAAISGKNLDWKLETFSISAGTHILTWHYSKDHFDEATPYIYQDAGWLDQVIFQPGPSVSDISVEQPAGTPLTDGTSRVTFDRTAPGATTMNTFTIWNLGTQELTGLAVTKDGADAGDFTVGALGVSSLAPGEKKTFKVTFAPGNVGLKTASIHIHSNDPDENPFDINLTADSRPLYEYTSDGGQITITGYNGSGGDLVIPCMIDGLPVMSIGRNAFYGLTSLTSVIIPDTVTSIAGQSFASCSGLTSVSIPKSVSNIETNAFYDCIRLHAIAVESLNPNYSSLDGVLFNKYQTTLVQFPAGKTGSYLIPNTVSNIYEGAFYGCSGLVSVTIPQSVTSVGSYPFHACGGLMNIGVDPLNSAYSSLDGVLFNKSQTELLRFPEARIGSYDIHNSVTSIGDGAFSDCSGLTSVTIPNSVNSIPSQAFWYCSGLANMTIPDGVSSIGYAAFAGCTRLTSVTISNSVTSIGSAAFAGCTSLTSVTIPNSVSKIESFTFRYCYSLASVTIPDSVTWIGSHTFQYCQSLTNATIPASLTRIDGYAFHGCSSLTNITFTGNTPYMEAGVFDSTASGFKITYFSGRAGFTSPSWMGYQTIMVLGPPLATAPTYTSVTAATAALGGNVTTDGGDPISIRGVVYSPTAINSNPQIGGVGVTNLTGAGTIGIFTVNASDLMPSTTYSFKAYATNNAGTSYSTVGLFTTLPLFTYSIAGDAITITKYNGPDGELILPGKIGGLSVTGIGESAFQGRSGLTRVVIPGGVTRIGLGAFSGCSGLSSVTIPDSITSIGNIAFSGCSSLTSVTIPDGVTSIGDFTFEFCSSLTSVTIPNTVMSIGEWAFSHCHSLESVTIPESVTNIGGWAFNYCPSLTWVIIPERVTIIGDNAFNYCLGLTAAVFKGNAPTMGWGVFDGAASGFKVYFLINKAGFTSPIWHGYPALLFQDPLILTDPASVGIHSGDAATLSVTAITIGTESLFYQWYQGASGIMTTPVGGNSSTFTTPALSATTSYWVKVTNAGNSGGADSNTATVAIIAPPLVATGFPNYISATSATLTGTVNPNHSATTARFEYGLTTAYGSTANVVLDPNDGSITQNVGAGIGGLQEGQTYHYRLIAANSAGTIVGDDMTLVTDARSTGFEFKIVDNTVTITRYSGMDYAVNIPATINGLPVTRIGEYAFYGNRLLDHVTLPNGVTSIGIMAFWSCYSLTSVTIPGSVTSI